MKFLAIGDTHITKSNLAESERLMDWILETEKQYKPDYTIFLGDQYDDFGIVHTEVLDFWKTQFTKFNSNTTIGLIGNHDEDSRGQTSAMAVHDHQIKVVGKTPLIIKNSAFVGFIRDNDKFIEMANDLPENITHCFCHAEFDGAQFEGGFFTTHGIDLTKLPKRITFVSGHIHRYMEYGNVFYGGTPRWGIRSDANTPKGIWLIDTETNIKTKIETPAKVATPYIQIKVTPNVGLEFLKEIKLTDRVFLDFVGPQDWIKESLKELSKIDKAGLVKLRTIPDRENVTHSIKESEGVDVAFNNYLGEVLAQEKLKKEVNDTVLKEIRELLHG